ncbi:hypothetical protein HYX12_03200 [Candidatus Woesearchaeota archaeon]|nr:hypothetical protein [Candidatus Woesearchaeota archaeon]
MTNHRLQFLFSDREIQLLNEVRESGSYRSGLQRVLDLYLGIIKAYSEGELRATKDGHPTKYVIIPGLKQRAQNIRPTATIQNLYDLRRIQSESPGLLSKKDTSRRYTVDLEKIVDNSETLQEVAACLEASRADTSREVLAFYDEFLKVYQSYGKEAIFGLVEKNEFTEVVLPEWSLTQAYMDDQRNGLQSAIQPEGFTEDSSIKVNFGTNTPITARLSPQCYNSLCAMKQMINTKSSSDVLTEALLIYKTIMGLLSYNPFFDISIYDGKKPIVIEFKDSHLKRFIDDLRDNGHELV